ncbi:hypothetical protein HDU91_005151 [Kappamyces sp. JEL0680]|nr:hypothetical protein HDU91_005151 [Kappamyces sp. JEL0680]
MGFCNGATLPSSQATSATPLVSPTAPSSSEPSDGATATTSPPTLSPLVISLIAVFSVLALLSIALLLWKGRRNPSSAPVEPRTTPFLHSQKPLLAVPVIKTRISPAEVLAQEYVCTAAYIPQIADELAMQPGDLVTIQLLFDDGYAKGTNHTTTQQGIFPVSHIEERLGSSSASPKLNP